MAKPHIYKPKDSGMWAVRYRSWIYHCDSFEWACATAKRPRYQGQGSW